MTKPGLIQVVSDSLSALPKYESINNDLDLIKQHNEKVRRYKFLLADVEALLDKEVQDLQNEDLRDQQVYVYKRARLLKLKDKLVSRVYLESEDCLEDLKDELQQAETMQNNSEAIYRLPDQELSNSFQSLAEELIARIDVDPELGDSLDAAHKQVSYLLKLDQKLNARRDLDKAVELLTKPLEPDENAQWVEHLEAVHQETDGLDIEYALRKHFFIVDYIHELLDSKDLHKWLRQKLEQQIKSANENAKECFSEAEIAKIQSLSDSLSNTKFTNLLKEWIYQQTNKRISREDLSQQEIIDAQQALESLAKEKWALQDLITDLQILVKDLNECIKYIQDINSEIEGFFSNRLVSKYFKNFISGIKDSESKAAEFPFKFYRKMCLLHKGLLLVKAPNLEEEDFPRELIHEVEIIGDRIRKRLCEDTFPLRVIPDFEKISLDQMSEKTASSVAEKLAKEPGMGITDPKEISILQLFSFTVERLIDYRLKSNGTEKATVLNKSALQIVLRKRLKKYFNDFKKLDEFLFPLDYLAGISEKQLIETYRISPEDARYGLSTFIKRGKRLEQKLAGDSLNAFGGFFKQSWRENDILWGRLDGLNRIVESLVTDEQIQRFPDFLEQHAKQQFPNKNIDEAKESYLDCLLNEALSIKSLGKSQLKRELKQELKAKIKTLITALETKTEQVDQKEITKHRAIFVQSLVRAGHLLILDEEQKFIHALGTALEKQPLRKYEVSREDKRMEAAFRDHYKVGSETLQDIPKSDWQEIRSRGFAIAKDILRTYRHRRYKRIEPKIVRKLKIGDIHAIPFIALSSFLLLVILTIPLLLSFPLILGVYIIYKVLRFLLSSSKFRRLNFTFFKFLVSLECLFFKCVFQLIILLLSIFFILSSMWKRITHPMKKKPGRNQWRQI